MVGRTAGGATDCEIVCREYVRKASSLYDSKMCIDYQYNDVDNSMHFQERWFDSSLFSFRFIVGSESLEGQLVNSQAPEIAIYLRTYLHASFHCSSLFVHSKQTGCIAANKFIWTVMILNGSEVSG